MATSRDLYVLVTKIIMSELKPHRRADLPARCTELGLPPGDEDAPTKAEYIDSRASKLADDEQRLRVVAERVTREFPVSRGYQESFQIEEMLWAAEDGPAIPKKYRRELARCLEGRPICLDGKRFLEALERLWVLEDRIFAALATFFGPNSHDNSLKAEIERHVIHNPGDWTLFHLFDKIGAFEVTDRRFCLLTEALASADVRPDESEQKLFVELANKALHPCGVELVETNNDGGYPVFALTSKAKGPQGRPKNLIFASPQKPDIRFRDAITNDVEIASNRDAFLVYEESIPLEGLRWRDLQTWWATKHGYDEEMAKTTLYRRLRDSLPPNSPPQRFLFEKFFSVYQKAVPELPALLPEVWLHWDPKTAKERGREALLRFRMDFLMLFSHQSRIVIEVDGKHHYADEAGRADANRYAKMVAADRELQLAGYEVYHFGATELDGDAGLKRVKEFFDLLFKRHGIKPGAPGSP